MLQKRSARPSFFDVVANKSLDHIKIDWHDNGFIEYEKQRTGVGEQGQIAIVEDIDEEQQEENYPVNGYNGYLSDMISVNRSLPDIRHSAYVHFLFMREFFFKSFLIPGAI
jgi:polypeptide N-acetylgalactosaminyltransferase